MSHDPPLWLVELTAWGTVASALFIALQAYYSRKLADETRQAIASSQIVEIETAKARLDSRGLEVAITLDSISMAVWIPQTTPAPDPPTNQRYGSHGPVSYATQVTADTIDISQTGEPPLMLQAVGLIVNNGTRAVEVTLEPPLLIRDSHTGEAGTRTTRAVVHAQKSVTFLMADSRPLTAWAENSHVPHSTDPRTYPCRITSTIVVDDRSDNGVRDTWQLVLAGAPLLGSPVEGPVYRYRPLNEGVPAIYSHVSAARRTYWLSKEAGQELPRYTRTRRRVRWFRLQREGRAPISSIGNASDLHELGGRGGS